MEENKTFSKLLEDAELSGVSGGIDPLDSTILPQITVNLEEDSLGPPLSPESQYVENAPVSNDFSIRSRSVADLKKATKWTGR